MLDLRRLALLREFSFRGTVTEVAAATGYTPSAVSQQLAQLEREAGTALLERSGRRLRLTPAGERLLPRIDELLDAMEAAEADLRDASSAVAGTVRVAAFQSAMLALVPDAVALLRGRAPGVVVRVSQREPEHALAETWAREFDLVIAEQYPHHSAPHYPGLERRPLLDDTLTLGVPRHGALAASVRSLLDAASSPWVLEPRPAASRHFVEQLCRQAGFEPDVRYETADLQAHVRLIEAGHAVGLVSGLLASGAPLDLTRVDLPGDPRRVVFTATRHAGRPSPAVAAVLAALDDAAATRAAHVGQCASA